MEHWEEEEGKGYIFEWVSSVMTSVVRVNQNGTKRGGRIHYRWGLDEGGRGESVCGSKGGGCKENRVVFSRICPTGGIADSFEWHREGQERMGYISWNGEQDHRRWHGKSTWPIFYQHRHRRLVQRITDLHTPARAKTSFASAKHATPSTLQVKSGERQNVATGKRTETKGIRERFWRRVGDTRANHGGGAVQQTCL